MLPCFEIIEHGEDPVDVGGFVAEPAERAGKRHQRMTEKGSEPI